MIFSLNYPKLVGLAVLYCLKAAGSTPVNDMISQAGLGKEHELAEGGMLASICIQLIHQTNIDSPFSTISVTSFDTEFSTKGQTSHNTQYNHQSSPTLTTLMDDELCEENDSPEEYIKQILSPIKNKGVPRKSKLYTHAYP
jgi:hypothetical protein